MSVSSHVPGIADCKITINHIDTYAKTRSIYPTLRMDFNFLSNKDVTLDRITADVSCSKPEGDLYFIGRALSIEPLLKISTNTQVRTSLILPLDHYGLNKIEKIRENQDLTLLSDLRFVCQVEGKSVIMRGVYLKFEIAKSDWVDKILPKFEFKYVALLEIPKLIDSEFKEISDHLNEAWKQYSMGTYNSVLVNCRRTLEALSTKIKKAGYKTKVKKEGTDETVPNWNKLMGNKDIGEIIKSINQKSRGFVAPAAHAGKAINREDADFALMVTHALVNLATRKLHEEE